MKRISALLIIAACALLAAYPAGAIAAAPPVLDQYGNPISDSAPIGAAAGGSDAVAEPAEADVLGNNAGAADDQGTTEVAAATGETVNAAAAAAPSDVVGALPFTGAELMSVVIAAILLLGSGLALRRVGFAGSRRARTAR